MSYDVDHCTDFSDEAIKLLKRLSPDRPVYMEGTCVSIISKNVIGVCVVVTSNYDTDHYTLVVCATEGKGYKVFEVQAHDVVLYDCPRTSAVLLAYANKCMANATTSVRKTEAETRLEALSRLRAAVTFVDAAALGT